MGRIFKKYQQRKQSWLRTKGIEVCNNIGAVAQQAVILAALSSDPQVAAIAIHENNQPSLEQLSDVAEIEKNKNITRQKKSIKKNIAGSKSSIIKQKIELKEGQNVNNVRRVQDQTKVLNQEQVKKIEKQKKK